MYLSKKEQFKNDPEVQQWVKELVQENLQKERSWSMVSGMGSPEVREIISDTPQTKPGIKSPSNSTIYTTALKRGVENNNVIDRISDFVDSIRLEHDRLVRVQQGEPNRHRASEEPHSQTSLDIRHVQPRTPVRETRDVADQIRIESEKNRGDIVGPKGNNVNLMDANGKLINFNPNAFFGQNAVVPPEIELLWKNDDDDDFFHITCHIDPILKAKIERGEYIDLERLLSRDVANKPMSKDHRVELVNHCGGWPFSSLCKTGTAR